MNKEQQIAEITMSIRNYSNKHDWKLFEFECENFAIVLHNLGYQKIDEDCAVITKAELKQYKVQAVKEFAEKVKEKALSNCRTINCYERKFIIETINELIKEI